MSVDVNIIPFSEELAVYFTNLNKAWVEKYFTIEPADEIMLGDPKKYIIDKGGYIFFAKVGNEIAGTFALVKVSDDVYELSKMAVDEKQQGKKIGNSMLEFCINKAKELGATKIQLYSNTILGLAIHLYRKYGFEEVPLENSEYKRSNIKMELLLKRESKLTPTATEKIQLYTAAMYLYSTGKSHPQVVKALSEYCYDYKLVNNIADKAMKNEWDKLYEKTRVLFSEGNTYDQVISHISNEEEDKDVADFIVNRWYQFKTAQMELIVEFPTNIAEGLQWVVISGLVIPFLFIAGANIISKILWIIVFAGALAQWILGISQRKQANKLNKFFESEIG